tara:strand:- start:1086 stop:1859 length:774 start_codon:yes stop_codon:yes gene_type:complete
MTVPNSREPLITLQRLSISFGHVLALREIDFYVSPGEVVALLGDNGAGKSTLAKILSGVITPDCGTIRFDGQNVSLTSPHHARQLGIETVYQDLALIPLMSIARNFFLARELCHNRGPFSFIDHQAMKQQTENALQDIGIKVKDVDEPVVSLSGGERQSIAIGRAVHFGSQLLILDEPTSALSIGETRKVLKYIDEARSRGLGVIFITHNLHHVFEVSDRITILHHGQIAGDFPCNQISLEETAEMIMGAPPPAHLL